MNGPPIPVTFKMGQLVRSFSPRLQLFSLCQILINFATANIQQVNVYAFGVQHSGMRIINRAITSQIFRNVLVRLRSFSFLVSQPGCLFLFLGHHRSSAFRFILALGQRYIVV